MSEATFIEHIIDETDLESASAETLTAEGFVEHVAEREGTTKTAAHRHAQAVLGAFEPEAPLKVRTASAGSE